MPQFNVIKKQIVITLAISAILIGIFLYVRNKNHGSGEKGKSKCKILEPNVPELIAESRNKFEITAAWTESKDVEKYKVYRYTEDPLKGQEAVQIEETEDNAIGFTNLKKPNQWIRVRAVNGCAISDFSNTVHIEMDSKLTLNRKKLEPKYYNGANCSSGKSLEWNRQIGAEGYGIFVQGGNYSRQMYVEDEGPYLKMEILFPDMEEPNSIVMTAVNSTGQSNLIVAHSKQK